MLLIVGCRKDGTAYTQEEIETLELLAHQAAVAMQIADLHHRLDQQQQELRQARGQLASSTRMTAIGEAISASAQEIQSSLQTIVTLADSISQEVDKQSASRQTLDAISQRPPMPMTRYCLSWTWPKRGRCSGVCMT